MARVRIFMGLDSAFRGGGGGGGSVSDAVESHRSMEPADLSAVWSGLARLRRPRRLFVAASAMVVCVEKLFEVESMIFFVILKDFPRI